MIGCVIASIVGIPLWMGAAGMVAVGVGMSFVRLPNGLRAGVYVEVWTRQVVEHYSMRWRVRSLMVSRTFHSIRKMM